MINKLVLFWDTASLPVKDSLLRVYADLVTMDTTTSEINDISDVLVLLTKLGVEFE